MPDLPAYLYDECNGRTKVIDLLRAFLIGVGVYYGIGLVIFLIVAAFVIALFIKIWKKFG